LEFPLAAGKKQTSGPGGISYELAEAIRSDLRACDLNISAAALARRHGIPLWIVQTIRKRVKRQYQRNSELAAFADRYAVPAPKK
jgi:hypothetical protein